MNTYNAKAITDRVNYALGLKLNKNVRDIFEDILIQVDFLLEKENEGWIPVSERLPEKEGHYLVTSELNYYHGGCWDETETGTSRSLAIAFYNGTDKIGGKNYWNHTHVIAWRELPDFYRGGK